MERAELYREAKKRGAIFDLSARAQWRVSGADRVRFMNGQVSNDVRKLAPGQMMRACVMTAKGKMSGEIFLGAEPDFLWIDAEPTLRESLPPRLERYIVADDVVIEDVTGEMCLLHVLAEPEKLSRSLAADIEQTAADRFGAAGVDLLIPVMRREELLQRLSAIFVLLDDVLSETIRIEAGVPRWGAELDEETIPAEAGLDRTAVDFHKGCYIGQEVISRIQSVGHVNRTLRGLVSAAPLAAGMEIFSEDSAKVVGRLTSATWSFGLEKFAALGYLKRGVDAASCHARAGDGTAREIEVRELPLIL